ncbi:GlcNAc-binding protein [Paenibacillus nuruki]|uniref:GlcNAc-binding protein n=1 Tax=Paenibacillus nuruki TaxID=1886670 RepID=A0A1E3KXE9_9BACL|nr:lytic polysaccharide monooxygenase [Paenibacillus nuruki]ODP26207.1 GlcNAc-binding protein [Paenibacillus nuruki]
MNWKKAMTATVAISTCALLMSSTIWAHGYIEQPASRAYKGSNALGLNTNVGSAQYEPQSIEALKGYPSAGPTDGHIASGGVAGFGPLDDQTSTRWHKTDIKTGALKVQWKLTAQHATASWKYYITKQGWNPNEPLKRSTLQEIAVINDKGAKPAANVSHTINIPSDRSGYHVILGVWDISDTANAFYQVIDVNITGQGTGGTTPTTPTDPGQPSANAWSPSMIYVGGDTVSYDGKTYRAKWWTSGEMPGHSDVWELLAGLQ